MMGMANSLGAIGFELAVVLSRSLLVRFEMTMQIGKEVVVVKFQRGLEPLVRTMSVRVGCVDRGFLQIGVLKHVVSSYSSFEHHPFSPPFPTLTPSIHD